MKNILEQLKEEGLYVPLRDLNPSRDVFLFLVTPEQARMILRPRTIFYDPHGKSGYDLKVSEPPRVLPKMNWESFSYLADSDIMERNLLGVYAVEPPSKISVQESILMSLSSFNLRPVPVR
jgi:hypothetical protein